MQSPIAKPNSKAQSLQSPSSINQPQQECQVACNDMGRLATPLLNFSEAQLTIYDQADDEVDGVADDVADAQVSEME